MNSEDLARLSKLYPEGSIPTEIDALAALGLRLPNFLELREDIIGDLIDGPPFGIHWWDPKMGTRRRIHVTDQLLCCLQSVSGNLTEARLHLLEYRDAATRDSDLVANAVSVTDGLPRFLHPPPRSAYEQLLPSIVDLHKVGVIRALASSLDCLAGVMIGVTGLTLSILESGFRSARNDLASVAPTTPGKLRQVEFANNLMAAVAESGPNGWVDWTLDFRNMLVHRGRRSEFGQITPRLPKLFDPIGQPIVRARRISHLPRDPAKTDVEVFLEEPWTLALQEDAEQTLAGLTTSTRLLVERISVDLRQFWGWRKANPSLLRQPKSQWPSRLSNLSTGFPGYAPGSAPLNATMSYMHPLQVRRIRAAALDDARRAMWTTFD